MLKRVSQFVYAIPVAGPLLRDLRRARRNKQFSSTNHWEHRYVQGGNSGAGSYGRLAEFKAEWLNQFVTDHGIGSVIELGCGDGNQLSLANYPRYVGLDVSATAVEQCRQRFSDDRAKRFVHSQPKQSAACDPSLQAELALSLDVIYHLIEDATFEAYMAQLFECATKYVIVYASNHDEQTDVLHVRHRKFTAWIGQHRPEWQLIEHVPNRYPFDPNDWENTSFADFYVFGKRD